LALAEGPGGSAAAEIASRRLFSIVEFIRSANSRTADAAMKKRNVSPDEAEQFQAVVDDIIALNGEMSALLLANTAVLRAAMKRGRRWVHDV
jgi:hypothetical protein